MRRVAAVVSLTTALLLACGSFGADDPASPIDTRDGGPISGDDAGGGDASPIDTDAGPVRACQPRFEDNFERDPGAILQGPWIRFEKNGTNELRILDQGTDTRVLQVTTRSTDDEVGSHAALLSTGPIAAPKTGIVCSFRMKPLVEFASENGALNDLFVYRLRYADGRVVDLRAAYTKASNKDFPTFTARDDRRDAAGKCSSGRCPVDIAYATASSQIEGAFGNVKVSMTYDAFTVLDGDEVIERTSLGLERPQSIEILIGILAFSPYEQAAYFDDLSCGFDCE